MLEGNPMAEKQDVFDQALKLPPEARAELAHDLLVSLDEEDENADALWVREIERRAQEVVDGTARTVSLGDACDRITKRLEQRRRK